METAKGCKGPKICPAYICQATKAKGRVPAVLEGVLLLGQYWGNVREI